MFACTTILGGGVLERFKKLRVSLLEAGIGWLPYYLERLDEHWEHRPQEFPNIDKAPSAYFAEGRMFVSTEGEDGVAHAIERCGVDWIVWASDYPHWDCHYPHGVTGVVERDDVTADQRTRIFSTNAQRLFGW
jgi:predicted TIM-barrel fold metal-dependent hydrolase